MPRLALPILTERLTLRSMRAEDHADVLAYRSRSEVGVHLPCGVLNGDQVADWIAESVTAGRIDQVHPAMTLAVELDGRVIGDVLLRADEWR